MSAQVVAQAKQELEAAGEDLSGPCGAFKICNLSAKKLGLGILDKPNGNNCQGYATDIVMARDGRIWDCLIDGGGANGPAWNPGEPVEASRYRDPIGTAPQPPEPPQPPIPPVPPVPPTVPPVNLEPVLAAIKALEEANERRYLDILQHFKAIPTIPPAPNYEGSIFGARITLRPVK